MAGRLAGTHRQFTRRGPRPAAPSRSLSSRRLGGRRRGSSLGSVAVDCGYADAVRPVPPSRAGRLSAIGWVRLTAVVLLLAGALVHIGQHGGPGVFRDMTVSVTGCSASTSPATAEVTYEVVNTGVAVRRAVLRIEYLDGAGRTIATATDHTAAIKPGSGVVSATVTSLTVSPQLIRCRVRATAR